MATISGPRLGTCPDCGAAVTDIDVLIEYESDGRPAAYAECSGCGAVVDPLQEDR